MGKVRKKKIPVKGTKVTRVTGEQATARKVVPTPEEGYLDAEGRKRLTREDLLEIELLRVKANEQMQMAQKMHLNAEQIEFNAKLSAKALRQEALLAEKRSAQYKDEQALLFNRLGPKYGINFKVATYDDETGIIQVMDEKEPTDKPPDTTIN
jgi:hypothetical protein